MLLVDAIKNIALDAAFPTGTGADRCYLGAHTDYHATGGNLHGSVTAGAWAAAASGSKALSGTVNLTITGAVTVKWIGVWGGSSGDTFRGMIPNGSTGDKTFQVDLTNNTIVCEAHGWSNTQKITFHGGTAPTGLTAGTTYFVRDVTAGDPDTFKVAATSGGDAIDLTGQPGAGCVVSNIIEETYAAGGTHSVTALTITL